MAVASFACLALHGQGITEVLQTEKGQVRLTPTPHTLDWWTENPLRLDSAADLMIGKKTPERHQITAEDYTVEQTVETIGIVAGFKVTQVMTLIHPGPNVIAAGWAAPNGQPAVWKDLLVSPVHSKQYVEIFGLHIDTGGLFQETRAVIYGQGPNAVLGTYDRDTGNGGGCADGYWWFDKNGPHQVDFSPLLAEVQRTLPPNAAFTGRCWALHPGSRELKSWVQKRSAECRTCGGLGEVRATYRINDGVAHAVTVHFEPSKD